MLIKFLKWKVVRWIVGPAAWIWRIFRWSIYSVVTVLVLMFAGNLVFHSQRGVPYRALDPNTAPCQGPNGSEWNVLSEASGTTLANDEWAAIDSQGDDWQKNLSCSIQRHTLPGYSAADGSKRDLNFDLAFMEFQEDGKPYALRELCEVGAQGCSDEGYGPVRKKASSQLAAILDRLKPDVPHYVMVFVHGWRHDASIGDANVAQFREYAAHAARFLEDRWDGKSPKPRVMAVYVGWRGARTDETWLTRQFGILGSWVGEFSAILTLFDRKPVSEAIAPSVLSGLRAIEQKLGLEQAPLGEALEPVKHANRMIVFGHSLGGNLLATALENDVLKAIARHKPETYMPPVLGDLVVLLNPASEASKWISIQHAVWSRIAFGSSERRQTEDYEDSHKFFLRNQAPVIVSVTAARDWPPGGRAELDCFNSDVTATKKENETRAVVAEGFQYDWATYDMFPAFKGDLRPAADTLKRIALGTDPHDACDETPVSTTRQILALPLTSLGAFLRILPFMQTDPEQTRTIGNVDPPRSPRGTLRNDFLSARPVGTTHELRGLDAAQSRTVRRTARNPDSEVEAEIPLTYEEVLSRYAACPSSRSWLLTSRNESESRDRKATGGENHGVGWDSDFAGAQAPALEFRHGFKRAGVAPITRANDPFWNIRAFDTALARHDGYMLSSFICAMNQLVMDDIVAPDAEANSEIFGKPEGQ